MLFRLLLALAALLTASVQARAEPVFICLDIANPPFMYANADGKASGVYPAILDEAFRRMDTPVHVEAMPWKRALALAFEGKSGIGGIYRNSARLKTMDFSDVLYVERILVVTLAARKIGYTSIASLTGLRVGVLRGWSYGDAFDKARSEGLFTIEEVDGDGQNLAKLQAGRIDAMIGVKENLEMHLSSSGKRELFTVHSIPLAENESFLAFAKSSSKKDLLARFNAALAQMRSDGTLQKMVLSLMARN